MNMHIHTYRKHVFSDMEAINNQLRELIEEQQRLTEILEALKPDNLRIRSQFIRQALMEVSGLSWDKLICSCKIHDYVIPRMAGMYLLYKHAGHDKSSIGRIFGYRDHSTVWSAVKRVQNNPERFAAIINPIEKMLEEQ